MRRIAYLTGPTYRGRAMPPGTLPPADVPEHALLAGACAARGMELVITPWDAAPAGLNGIEAALIRSCWDYAAAPDRFVAALESMAAAGIAVLNPPATVAWNARKTYLAQIERAGAPIIQTLFAECADTVTIARAFETFEASELVVKPQVGAGGRNTLRLKRNGWSTADLIDAPTGPAMLQPYQPAIVAEGEWSFVFFGGAFCYAILKKPAPGGWLAPNSQGAINEAADPTPADLAAAQHAFAVTANLLAEPPLYARVDMVRGTAGALVLMEVELIEPALYFGCGKDFAGALAAKL
jgi:glutathione synthase/RimK-type ligase-like ATP-grasp enzyme